MRNPERSGLKGIIQLFKQQWEIPKFVGHLAELLTSWNETVFYQHHPFFLSSRRIGS